jgi:DNA-binding CsgD family transcriptional regulator
MDAPRLSIPARDVAELVRALERSHGLEPIEALEVLRDAATRVLRHADTGGEGAAVPPLRPRYRETLEWLLTGATEKEIAVGLGLSVHTVHQYVKAIYKRFEVTSRAQLMASRLRPVP